MRAPGGLEREQPRVLQRDRGLVGEVLQPPDLLGAEGAAGDVADREHPGHPTADGERHREHRAVSGPLDHGPRLRVHHHARIGQDVRRRDRGSLAHREPGHQLVPRNDGARREDPARAGGGDRHEPPRDRVELPQDGHGAAQQRPDPFRDVPAHAGAVERLHEGAPHRGQRGRVASRGLLARDHRGLVALDAPPLGEIAQDQHRADHQPARIAHRGAALVDGPLVPVAPDEQGARPPGQAPVTDHAHHRALDRRAGLLADQRADLGQPPPPRLVGATAGETLGGRVHERDALGRVGDHDRVADAGERDRQLLVLLAHPILGAPPARGRGADPARDHQEEQRADQVVAVGWLEERESARAWRDRWRGDRGRCRRTRRSGRPPPAAGRAATARSGAVPASCRRAPPPPRGPRRRSASAASPGESWSQTRSCGPYHTSGRRPEVQERSNRCAGGSGVQTRRFGGHYSRIGRAGGLESVSWTR